MRAEEDRDERHDGDPLGTQESPPEQRDLHTQSAKPVAVVFGVLIILVIMMWVIWQLAVRAAGT